MVLEIGRRIFGRLSDGNVSREMDYGLDLILSQQVGELICFTQVKRMKDCRWNGPTMATAQIVNDQDRISLLFQEVASMGTDVTGSSGNENGTQALPSLAPEILKSW